MIMRGCVKGGVYPIAERVYEQPIDGTYICKWCKRKFVPSGRGKHTYCSDECRKNGLRESHRKASTRYKRRKVCARRSTPKDRELPVALCAGISCAAITSNAGFAHGITISQSQTAAVRGEMMPNEATEPF